jgi:segregation and condensation protein B
MPNVPAHPVDTAPTVDEIGDEAVDIAPALPTEAIHQSRAEEISASQTLASTTDVALVHAPVAFDAPTILDQSIRDIENMSVPGPVDSTLLDAEELDPEAIDPAGSEDTNEDVNNGDGNEDGDDANHNANHSVSANSHESDDGLPLTALLESLLFVTSEPVEPSQLARTLAQPLQRIEEALVELTTDYQQRKRGLRVQRLKDKVQLVTAPAAAPFIEHFLNLDATTRLSGPALEALAIIAYRQPVTRAQIEAVRGVDCAGVLRSLVQRGLVADVGRAEGVGRPILYGVTELFMQHFGLMEMTELPPLEETDADRLWAATILEEQSPNSVLFTSGEETNSR